MGVRENKRSEKKIIAVRNIGNVKEAKQQLEEKLSEYILNPYDKSIKICLGVEYHTSKHLTFNFNLVHTRL
ncbi:Hypothetical predicted protein [Octopus vulgaris]|uniref:Uncharacterized protein n=1 Tax=Octopus vulgaris TaxID=6645 RepID=A0AA36AI07_OCTVU|nr:Hypothetical predicted protein [Octopus vulgaris]